MSSPSDIRTGRVLRATAMAQGLSYIGFGAWALGGREHYVRVHGLGSGSWLLRAHAGWMLLVGGALTYSAARGRLSGEVRALGLGSALALAANDVVSRRTVARIYQRDLAWESVLLAGWAVGHRRASEVE